MKNRVAQTCILVMTVIFAFNIYSKTDTSPRLQELTNVVQFQNIQPQDCVQSIAYTDGEISLFEGFQYEVQI